MVNQDFLVIGLTVTLFVILANLLFFVLLPMSPVIFNKVKSLIFKNSIDSKAESKQ